jgi:hypothetical protein
MPQIEKNNLVGVGRYADGSYFLVCRFEQPQSARDFWRGFNSIPPDPRDQDQMPDFPAVSEVASSFRQRGKRFRLYVEQYFFSRPKPVILADLIDCQSLKPQRSFDNEASA